jgi:cellulose synthase/poly-beta-1,6-N-acetylglucosamine synthase-like glycosyltransferase
MAWSRFNGLLLVSGAFGMFKRDIVIKVGGYNTDLVGRGYGIHCENEAIYV